MPLSFEPAVDTEEFVSVSSLRMIISTPLRLFRPNLACLYSMSLTMFSTLAYPPEFLKTPMKTLFCFASGS
jgi:hypothetical protein